MTPGCDLQGLIERFGRIAALSLDSACMVNPFASAVLKSDDVPMPPPIQQISDWCVRNPHTNTAIRFRSLINCYGKMKYPWAPLCYIYSRIAADPESYIDPADKLAYLMDHV